jgi:predicted DNA-binding transcriptional regulator
MTTPHLSIVRQALAAQGFIATEATNYVWVELRSRSVSVIEITRALMVDELDELCRVVSNYDGRARVYPID